MEVHLCVHPRTALELNLSLAPRCRRNPVRYTVHYLRRCRWPIRMVARVEQSIFFASVDAVRPVFLTFRWRIVHTPPGTPSNARFNEFSRSFSSGQRIGIGGSSVRRMSMCVYCGICHAWDVSKVPTMANGRRDSRRPFAIVSKIDIWARCPIMLQDSARSA